MKEKILELRRKGLTINEIVNELGCAKATVSYHINRNGLGGELKPRIYFKKEENVELVKQIKTLRLESKTYTEILSVVDITKDELKKICRRIKLNKPKGFDSIVLDKKEVLKKYLVLKSIRKTAISFGVDKSTIRRYIDDEHIIIKREKLKTKSQVVIDWRKRCKIKLVDYKGGCCERCGYSKSIAVLQFHHTDPSEKDFTISGRSYSFERLKKEVDKCILVCANCHLEIHEELRNNGLVA